MNERKEMQREIQRKRGITEARMFVTLRDIVTVAALIIILIRAEFSILGFIKTLGIQTKVSK